jgi:hypothetical protein
VGGAADGTCASAIRDGIGSAAGGHGACLGLAQKFEDLEAHSGGTGRA